MRFLTVTLVTAFGLQAAGQTASDPRSLSRSELNPPAQLSSTTDTDSSSRFSCLLGAVETARPLQTPGPFAKTECELTRPTPPVAVADPYGDSDGDGVEDEKDWCPNTVFDPEFEDEVNDYGCALSEMDGDNDCVNSLLDACPQTKWGNRGVDDSGCPGSDSWTLSGVAEGYEPGDSFGQTVAVSADGLTVAVGAPDHDWLGSRGSGQVVIFTDEGGVWFSEELGDPDFINFGRTLAMSGDGSKLAVAQNASRDGDGNGILSTVQVYERSGSSWVQLGDDIALGADVNDDRDSFGAALAMDHSGETLAVGAPGSDGGAGNNDQRGEVRVYRLSGNAWVQLGQGIQGRGTYESSGVSVALSSADGTVVAIGTGSNRARAYCLEGEEWLPRGGTQADVEGSDGEFLGNRLVLSGDGDTLIVGRDFGAIVKTFQWHDDTGGACAGSWAASQSLSIDREQDGLGDAVRMALSADGKSLLASAPYSGDIAGQVRLYRKGLVADDWAFQQNSGGVGEAGEACPSIEFTEGWFQAQRTLEGEPQESLGEVIALSGDGKTVVIGSPYYDGDPGNEGTDRGRAAVYRLP